MCSESSDVKVTFTSPSSVDGVVHAFCPPVRLKTTCVSIELFGSIYSAKAIVAVLANRTRSICGLLVRCSREGTLCNLLWPIGVVLDVYVAYSLSEYIVEFFEDKVGTGCVLLWINIIILVPTGPTG